MGVQADQAPADLAAAAVLIYLFTVAAVVHMAVVAAADILAGVQVVPIVMVQAVGADLIMWVLIKLIPLELIPVMAELSLHDYVLLA